MVVRGALAFNRAQAHLAELRQLLDEYGAHVTDALFVVSTTEVVESSTDGGPAGSTGGLSGQGHADGLGDTGEPGSPQGD